MNRPAILTQPTASALGQQNLTLFRVYVGYRALLSIVLLIMLVSPNTRQLVGVYHPTLYTTVALAYLATSIPLVGSLSTRRPPAYQVSGPRPPRAESDSPREPAP